MSRFLDGLNPSQREAVTTTEGPLLVLAGAGTGKTRVVTHRIAHLMEKGVSARGILAVTFTNKAAREMHERVGALVGRGAARGLTICTFHAFALRLLRDNAESLELGKRFTIASDDDRLGLFRTVLRESGVSERAVPPRLGLARIGDWKNELLEPDDALDRACDEFEVLVAMAWQRYQKEMRRRHTVDFDDMIYLAVRLLRDDPDVLRACRDRYRYLMVDEYQDTNGSQHELVRLIATPRRNLCVVGDDDQSIYGWRGARAGNILEFGRDYRGAKTVVLDQNYRSTNAILAAANAVITNNLARREKRLWSALGDGDPVALYRAEDERDEEQWVAGRIDALRRDGVKDEDVAILFRANAQSANLEVCLRARGIPYRVVGTRSVFDRREVRDLLAYLKVLVNPKDDGACMRILNTPARGIGATTRARLVEAAVAARSGVAELLLEGVPQDLPARARDAVRGFRQLLETLRAQVENGSVRDVLEALVAAVGYEAHVEMEAKDPLEAQIRVTVVRDLIDMAARYDAAEPKGGAAGFLEALALDARDDDGDEEQRGVNLMTVHAAKGLEFDHVFIVGVEEELFPHKNSIPDGDREDGIDEERRLFYVAITRARRSLSLVAAATRTRYGRQQPRKESRFIAEIGEERLEVIDPATDGPADDATVGAMLERLKQLGGES